MSSHASVLEQDTVRDLTMQIHRKNLSMGQRAIMDLYDEYRSKYADALGCHLLHIMIGSTVLDPVRPDFPGADSVIKRLRGILQSF